MTKKERGFIGVEKWHDLQPMNKMSWKICCHFKLHFFTFQEKTDEVTNKFLDKRKDISTYHQTQSQPLAAVNIDEDLQEIKEERFHHPVSYTHLTLPTIYSV